MNTPVTPLPDLPLPGYWPVDVTHYDRSPDLHEAERAELERLMSRKPFQLCPSSKLLRTACSCLWRMSLLSPTCTRISVARLRVSC